MWAGVGEWVWPGIWNAAQVRLTMRVLTGTTRVFRPLSRRGLYLLWFLFITHKSFAFY